MSDEHIKNLVTVTIFTLWIDRFYLIILIYGSVFRLQICFFTSKIIA